jgi:HK97 family phage major capsid protein
LNPLDQLTARLDQIRPRYLELSKKPDLDDEEREEYAELHEEWTSLEQAALGWMARESRRRAVAASGSYPDTTTTRESYRGSDARSVALRNIEASRIIDDRSKERAFGVVENARTDPACHGVAAFTALVSDEDYCRAYTKWLRYPDSAQLYWTPEEQRAWVRTNEEYRAMSAGGATSGSALVPLYLDPTFVVTGAGARNAFRQVSNVKQITTFVYNGSTAAQITAGLLGENAAYSDNTPTVTAAQIPTYKLGAWIPASFELFEDADALAADVAELFADARLSYETTQMTTGTGSAPHGVVADVGAVTASRVAATTGGTFGLVDAFNVHSALPARFRNRPENLTWMSNVALSDRIRQLTMAQNSGNSVWTDLGGGTPPRFLGDQYFECSAMASAVTTGSDVLLEADFSRYYIIDRLGLQTELIPNVMDQATGRPLGQRGFICHWRYGSSMVDPNAGRLLRL